METMEKIYAGINVDCNEEGYLTNLDQWNTAVGLEIAKEEGITMTDKHWEVIAYLQDQYKKEIPLSIRKVGKSGVVSIKEFYELFPNGPLKISSKIAGIPKPVSCI
jgi:tRNA 2-thiouridine synthesizing protein E